MGSCDLPPGFRFHPTDEELIMHYLRNQATSKPCPASIIPEVDFYKFDPWQLPDKAEFGENEWYFFTPRDRKYPNGVRPNRATVSGYWKATGTDKAIYSASKYVGVKKALVFYKGRPPKGVKTDWIMHEYRLIDSKKQASKQIGSMRLDDWVLCRIYKKRHTGRASMEVGKETDGQFGLRAETGANDGIDANEQQEMMKISRTWSLSNILEMDLGQLLSDHSYSYNTMSFNFQNNLGNGQPEKDQQPQDMLDLSKFQINQPFFGNPVTFEF